MVAGDRQRVIETNRSIRLIKNELESLLEKDVITEDVFDSISRQLPGESGLSGTGSGPATPLPAATPSSPPTHALANVKLAPPSYTQSAAAGPPPLPGRAAPPTGKPVLARARALYAYTASDARDLSLEPDDPVAVLEHMNADWCLGRNERSGREGIFPRTYVDLVPALPPPQLPLYGGGYPAPPPSAGPVNPYHAPVPPMAVADPGSGPHGGGGGGGKMGEHGKKIGKKLGNAAIFGAGATIGSNIVNSIF